MTSFQRLSSGFAAAVLLAGCTMFRSEYVDCPSVKLREGTERVVLVGAELGDLVAMRIRNVAARCKGARNGTRMQVGFALILERESDRPQEAETVPFDATFAFLDANGGVVSRFVHSEEILMESFQLATDPVVTMEMQVPKGATVVFGLGKAE